MASELMPHTSRVFGTKEKHVKVRIFPNGTNAPTFKSAGGVESVVRSSQGLFLVTLSSPYRHLSNFNLDVQSVAAAARYPQLGTVANLGTASAVTVQVRLVDGSGAVQDMSADANTSIGVELQFEDADTRLGAP